MPMPHRPLFALMLTLLAAPAFAQQAQSKVSDDIAIAASQRAGGLETVSGDISLASGAQAGTITSVSGDIDIAARSTAGAVQSVSGDIDGADDVQLGNVETVSGDVRLGARGRAGEVQSVSGDLRFGGGVRVRSLETVSGEVFIDRGGNVDGNVHTVSGSIGLVATTVSGGVQTYTGNVTIGVDSHVRGGLTVRKPNNGRSGVTLINVRLKQTPPRIVIGPNARVDGALVFEHPVKLYVHRSARIGRVTGATPVPFDTARPPQN